MLKETAGSGCAVTPQPAHGRPMRVARVITRLNVGGPGRHAILLTAGMDRARFDTTLITGVVGRHEGDLSELARASGIAPLLIPELGRPIRPAFRQSAPQDRAGAGPCFFPGRGCEGLAARSNDGARDLSLDRVRLTDSTGRSAARQSAAGKACA